MVLVHRRSTVEACNVLAVSIGGCRIPFNCPPAIAHWHVLIGQANKNRSHRATRPRISCLKTGHVRCGTEHSCPARLAYTVKPQHRSSISIRRALTTTKRIGRLLVYWLGFLWTSPNTLLGAFFAVFMKLSGGSWRLVEGNLECSGRLLQRCFGLLNPSFDFGAITFGHVILGRNER